MKLFKLLKSVPKRIAKLFGEIYRTESKHFKHDYVHSKSKQWSAYRFLTGGP